MSFNIQILSAFLCTFYTSISIASKNRFFSYV